MSHAHLKFTLAGIALAAAVGLLVWSGIREGWVYFMQVDQFVEDQSYHTQRVRLHGLVSSEDLQIDRGLLAANFYLLGDKHQLRINYQGVIPDLFKADQDVVIEGILDNAEIFQADTLMTKCASKYETQDGEAPHTNPQTAEDES